MKRPATAALSLRALILLAACAALAGCGGGGGGSTASTATAEAHPGAAGTTTSAAKSAKPGGGSNGSGGGGSTEPGPEASAFVPKPHHDSGGGSAQFRVKGGDNSVQEFGAESSESELHKAAAALHGFLDARAERDWAAACAYLSSDVAKSLQQLTAGSQRLKERGCAAILAALSGKVPTSTLAEAAQADVGSLRLQGDRAFVIYRGAHNTVYAISMTKDGGSWKVAALGGTPLG